MSLTAEELHARVRILTKQIGFWLQEREDLKQRLRDLGALNEGDGSALQPVADAIADRLGIPRVVVPLNMQVDASPVYWTTEHSMACLVLAFINARP